MPADDFNVMSVGCTGLGPGWFLSWIKVLSLLMHKASVSRICAAKLFRQSTQRCSSFQDYCGKPAEDPASWETQLIEAYSAENSSC